MRPLLPLVVAGLAYLVLLQPSAAACHPGLGARANVGVVAADDGPVPASILLRNCEGLVPITVVLHTPGGDVVDQFPATLDIVAPDVRCFGETCTPVFPPVAAFTLRNADLGVDLVGTFQNSLHFALAFQLSGFYRDQAAAFTIVLT